MRSAVLRLVGVSVLASLLAVVLLLIFGAVVASASRESVRFADVGDPHVGISPYVFSGDGAYHRETGAALWRLTPESQARLPPYTRSRMTVDGEHAVLFGPEVLDPWWASNGDRLAIFVVNAWGTRLVSIGRGWETDQLVVDISHGTRLLEVRAGGQRVIARMDIEAGVPLYPSGRAMHTQSQALLRRVLILAIWIGLGAGAVSAVGRPRDVMSGLSIAGALLVCAWLGVSESGLFPL